VAKARPKPSAFWIYAAANGGATDGGGFGLRKRLPILADSAFTLLDAEEATGFRMWVGANQTISPCFPRAKGTVGSP
jgi:hypothetical protein